MCKGRGLGASGPRPRGAWCDPRGGTCAPSPRGLPASRGLPETTEKCRIRAPAPAQTQPPCNEGLEHIVSQTIPCSSTGGEYGVHSSVSYSCASGAPESHEVIPCRHNPHSVPTPTSKCTVVDSARSLRRPAPPAPPTRGEGPRGDPRAPPGLRLHLAHLLLITLLTASLGSASASIPSVSTIRTRRTRSDACLEHMQSRTLNTCSKYAGSRGGSRTRPKRGQNPWGGDFNFENWKNPGAPPGPWICPLLV